MNPYNRAEILDINFSQKLKNGSLPDTITKHSISDLGLKASDIISIFESQVFSRHMDIKARELKEKGECFYTIGSSGHESNAVFGHIFPYTDIAFYIIAVAHFLLRDLNKFLAVVLCMIWLYLLWLLQMIQLVEAGIKSLGLKS